MDELPNQPIQPQVQQSVEPLTITQDPAPKVLKTRFRKILDTSLWVILAVFAPITVLILLSQNSLPGDFFYPVKRGMEGAILAGASLNPTTKALFSSNLADTRFTEANKLLLTRADTGSLTDFVDEVASTQQQINALTDLTQKAQMQQQLDTKINQYQTELRQTQVQLTGQNPSSNQVQNTTGSVQNNPQNPSPTIVQQTPGQTTIIQNIYYIVNPTTGQKEPVQQTPTPVPTTISANQPVVSSTQPTVFVRPTIVQTQPMQISPTQVVPTPAPIPTQPARDTERIRNHYKRNGAFVNTLRTLDQSLRPQTTAACREDVAQAILRVRIDHVTAAAKRARRERETLHALAIRGVAGIVP